jgi:uncharacterized protein (DUF2147 family)
MRFLRLIALLALVCALAATGPAHAQPIPIPVGYWQTRDGGGVVEVTVCGNALCGHLAGIVLDHPDDPMPTDWHGSPQCGAQLISNARLIDSNLWRGKITDPRDGKVYDVELHIDRDGRLAVRGFLGLVLLGRTDRWTRYHAVPAADCRMTPEEATAAGRIPGPDGSATE